MKEQLIQYVELLFAGAPNSGEIKQEILQNTLDRYDDLIAQGKSPEAAYRLAISGIGDINEILGGVARNTYTVSTQKEEIKSPIREESDSVAKRCMRAVAVALYILCAVPLIVLSDFGMDILGLCGTLAVVAAATVLMILGKKNKTAEDPREETYYTSPQMELRKSISNMIWAVGLAVYFILSFATRAWYITWVLFPIIGSVQGLVNACMDLKEATKYEN